MSDITFGVRLKADRGGFSSEMAGAGRDVRGFGDEARAATAGTEHLARGIGGVVRAAAGLAGLTLGAGLVREFVAAADAAGLLDARLRLATGSASEFADVSERLQRIALENNAGLTETVTLYTKLAPAVREAGGGVAETSAIVDAFEKTLRLSGASAQEAAASTLQFAQAMGSGKLSGDEFRSISETNLRLMQALANALGQPIGKLKEMAANGELTANVIGNALVGSLDQLKREADTLPTTVGEAFQNLGTEVLRAVQAINDEADITGGIVASIDDLRDRVPALAGELAGAARLIADNMDAAAFAVGSTLALGLGRAAGAGAASAAALVSSTRAALAATVQYDALGVAVSRATAAQNAHAAATRISAGLIAGLGGPVGALVTVLGIGASAWLAFGQAGQSAAEQTESKIDAAVRSIERLRNQAKFGAGDVGQIREAIAAVEAEMARLAETEKRRGTNAQANQEWLYARQRITELGETLAELRVGLEAAEKAAAKQDRAIQTLTGSTSANTKGAKEAAKAADAMAKALGSWHEQRRRGLETIDDEIAAEREAREAIGKSRDQVLEMEAAKLELAAAGKQVEAANLAEAAAFAGPLAAAYRQAAIDADRAAARLRELASEKRATAGTLRGQDEEAANAAAFDAFIDDLLRREKASAEASERMAQEHARAWQAVYDDVGRGLTDAIFEGGSDGWDLLKRTIEATFIRAYVQPVFTQGVAAIGQAFGLGGPAGAGGGAVGGAGNLLTNGSTLYSAGGTLAGYGQAFGAG
ncbi:MAG: tape measure protein, partial [Rhodocyclaceae bacterium]|nr:tape measure protein [Rhodocyclaceae bacterium]